MDGAILITGASRGIGRELARVCARHGHPLVLAARSYADLEALATELRDAHGTRVEVIVADLAAAGGAGDLAAEIARRGIVLEALVNNAGSGLMGAFHEQDAVALDQMVQLNVRALTQLTRLLVPEMVARGRGRVLNVASQAAFQPGPTMAAYHATKSYVLFLSRALSFELRRTGVTVTCLCPGASPTSFNEVAGIRDGLLQRATNVAPDQVARAGYRGMMRGRAIVIPGLLVRLSAHIARVLPLWLSTRLAAGAYTSARPTAR